jgi:hypothetical protein
VKQIGSASVSSSKAAIPPAKSTIKIGRPPLQKSQCTQIFARFIEAATAKRSHQSPACFDLVGRDFQLTPGKRIVAERKRGGIFVLTNGEAFSKLASPTRSGSGEGRFSR